MQARLDRGQYYGAVLGQVELASALLVETCHPAGARIPPHAHRNAYFCFVQQGAYEETYGGHARECGPLTLAFHPPDEVHSERMSGAEVRSFNIEVKAAWLSRVCEAAPALRGPADCRGGPAAWLALRLYREFRHRDALTPLVIEGLLLEIAAELARAAAEPRGAPRWLIRVQDLLRTRFAENLSLAEVAAEAGVHPVHLAAVFRRCLGRSVGEFVRACRVEHAAGRLARRGGSLAAIALEAGFADQSHLTRVFKRLTGMTPAAYRRQLGT